MSVSQESELKKSWISNVAVVFVLLSVIAATAVLFIKLLFDAINF